MSKHTPGPWVSPWDLPEGASDDDSNRIVNAQGATVIGLDWYDGPFLAVSQEDAALICAAPDLLEAAERTVLYVAGNPDGDNHADVMAALVAAVKKARGES